MNHLLRCLVAVVTLIGAAAASADLILINSETAGIQCTATTCFELRVIDDPNFNAISWDTARFNAADLGGTLATPETTPENDILLARKKLISGI